MIVLAARWGAFVVSERPTLMIYSTAIGRLDQFLIGMLAATLAPWLVERGRGAAIMLAAGAAAALLIALGWQSVHASFLAPPGRNAIWIVWPTVEALLWSALIVGFVAWRPRWPGRLGPALATAGSWSFSLYMWHALVIVLVQASLPLPAGSSALWIATHAGLTAAARLPSPPSPSRPSRSRSSICGAATAPECTRRERKRGGSSPPRLIERRPPTRDQPIRFVAFSDATLTPTSWISASVFCSPAPAMLPKR